MPRATNNPASRRRRKKILKMSKGYRGGRNNLYRPAHGGVWKGLVYAFRDRRRRKREFRALWIMRIGAAARLNDMNYNQFMNGLHKAGIELDRKALADLALVDAEAFSRIAERAKAALAA